MRIYKLLLIVLLSNIVSASQSKNQVGLYFSTKNICMIVALTSDQNMLEVMQKSGQLCDLLQKKYDGCDYSAQKAELVRQMLLGRYSTIKCVEIQKIDH